MLVAGPSGHECETKIGDRAAGEYTDMLPLLEMGQYETLPVDGQRIGGAVGSELKTAATRERLQQKMHLGIVSKRLEMAHTLDRSCNRFLVQDATGRKSDLDTIAFLHHTLQDLGLDLTHEMNVNLLLRTVPADMELREFVGERLQLPIELQRIHICANLGNHFRMDSLHFCKRNSFWPLQIFLISTNHNKPHLSFLEV